MVAKGGSWGLTILKNLIWKTVVNWGLPKRWFTVDKWFILLFYEGNPFSNPLWTSVEAGPKFWISYKFNLSSGQIPGCLLDMHIWYWPLLKLNCVETIAQVLPESKATAITDVYVPDDFKADDDENDSKDQGKSGRDGCRNCGCDWKTRSTQWPELKGSDSEDSSHGHHGHRHFDVWFTHSVIFLAACLELAWNMHVRWQNGLDDPRSFGHLTREKWGSPLDKRGEEKIAHPYDNRQSRTSPPWN